MQLRSLRSVSPEYLELQGTLNSVSPHSPPTWQPWFKAHAPYKQLYYLLEPVHLVHLACFLSLDSDVLSKPTLRHLKHQLRPSSWHRTAHRHVLGHKPPGSHPPTAAARGVGSFQENAWTCTNSNQRNYLPESFLIYSLPYDTYQAESTLQRGKLPALRQRTHSIGIRANLQGCSPNPALPQTYAGLLN